MSDPTEADQLRQAEWDYFHPSADDLSACPYFQGTGVCGYLHLCNTPDPEPRCFTDRPRDGWPSEAAGGSEPRGGEADG